MWRNLTREYLKKVNFKTNAILKPKIEFWVEFWVEDFEWNIKKAMSDQSNMQEHKFSH